MRREFDEVPDGELWLRASRHDSAAFGELFERRCDEVYNHCFRRTGSWSTAQDLTSVVFLQAWRRRKDVRLYGDSVLPWLLAVANNVIRNSDRSLRRYNRLLSKLPSSNSTPDFESEVDARLDDERAMATILERVNLLSREDREIIALCDWSDLSYAEAAVALDVPLGTVRSRLSRARVRLRVLLGEASVTQAPGAPVTKFKYREEKHDPS